MGRAGTRRLSAFMMISLDGYFADARGDMGFAHALAQDGEWNDFVAGNARGGGVLLFGRKTYELMASWWPTPAAAKANPVVAERMNSGPKVVFSRTLAAAEWSNTTLVREDAPVAVRRMKEEDGPGMVILGSGSIVTQVAAAGLLDTLQVVVTPVALGAGSSLLAGLGRRLDLALADTRVFRNGAVVLWYAPR